MASGEADLHGTAPDEFAERVRSFEFWFGAVQGYLDGTEFGCAADVPAPPLSEVERERLITCCAATAWAKRPRSREPAR
jgi:hypothetical protein